MKKFFTNGIHGVFTLVCASLAFSVIIFIALLLGALVSKEFPLISALLDNFHLVVILIAVSIPLGFFLGSIAGKLQGKRIFFISILGYILYWLLLVFILLIFSRSSPSADIFPGIIRLSVKAMLAYSFYAMPVAMVAVFLLEKWTRKK